MSPHAIPSPRYVTERDHCPLSQPEIESNGFLPDELPLELLPDPYYRPWELLIKNLPTLLREKTIRARVHELPVLSVSHLKTTSEWRRAYVILSFLAHGYIWGGDHASEVSCIVLRRIIWTLMLWYMLTLGSGPPSVNHSASPPGLGSPGATACRDICFYLSLELPQFQ